MHDLKDKIILVTGASGGIGKATALLLCEAGAKLGLLDVNEPESVVAEVKAQGGEAVAVACDVRDSKSVEHAIGAVVAAFGPLDGPFLLPAPLPGHLFRDTRKSRQL